MASLAYRRRVAERTLSWFGRNRRLARDFEHLAGTLETLVTLAAIRLALRRLCQLLEHTPPYRGGFGSRIVGL